MVAQSHGVIFDVQKYSLHDGPGIRSLVFMKGCPLTCQWCSNPESQNFHIEVGHIDKSCIRCGKCFIICDESSIADKTYQIDKSICVNCLKCVACCKTGAKKCVGEIVSVQELFQIVESDRVFYRNSGGGVTVGGGEPLSQTEFVSRFLKECKENSIHTALETCGYAPPEKIRPVLEHVDLLLYDLKHMDGVKHEEMTGKPNGLILTNAAAASHLVETVFRIPLIPGYNDDIENLAATIEFVESKCHRSPIEILPYHNLGTHKYKWLSKEYKLENLKPYSDLQKESLRKKISEIRTGVEIKMVV